MDKLTSVILQPMINIHKPNLDLLCPVLSFGRRKKDQYKLPVVFKDESHANDLYDELKLLIGKPIDEVRTICDSLYKKYKKFDYRYRTKKKINSPK